MKKRLIAALSAAVLISLMLMPACGKNEVPADVNQPDAVLPSDETVAADTESSASSQSTEIADSPQTSHDADETTQVSPATDIQVENPELTTVVPEVSQLGVTVDSWLKISAITEYNGVLAVVAENVSDTDVEYASLSVKTNGGTLTFNVSALLQGETALLLCNEAVTCNEAESYTSWQTENRVDFTEPPVMNENKIELQLSDGSISVKNISSEDITTDIFIYYKDKINNILNGSVTRRIRVSPLKAGANTFINTNDMQKENCQIIFTDF